MSIYRSDGITHVGLYDNRYEVPNAWDSSYGAQAGSITQGLGNNLGGSATWNEQNVRDNLYMDEQESYAQQMGDYGQQMFDLFDLYQPQFDYIAENAGVGGAELGQMLADSSAQYSANVDAAQAEQTRTAQRMGVNPNSGAYAAMGTSNALQKAAGLSSNQNQVRNQAQQQDMSERYQAAQMGLTAGGQGASAMNAAGGMYAQMGSQMQSSKQFYDQMQESSRQYNNNAKFQAAGMQMQEQQQNFNQAQNRYLYGLQANSTYNGFGDVTGMSYTYGF